VLNERRKTKQIMTATEQLKTATKLAAVSCTRIIPNK